MLEFAVIQTGDGSVATCSVCSIQADGQYRSSPEILAAARNAVEGWSPHTPGPNLALRGPDPFAHPDFDELLFGLSQLPCERMCLTTVGVAAFDTQPARPLVDNGITHLHVALFAPEAPANDRLTGMTGSFERVLQRAHDYQSACAQFGIDPLICGLIPVCRHNLEALPDTVAYLASRGVGAVTIDTSRAPGTAFARAWIAAALDTGMVSGVWVCESSGADHCAHEGLLGRAPVVLIEGRSTHAHA